MMNVPKHCWNLHHSTVIVFIGHWQGICVRKGLSCWHAKFWDCFLTHWLPIKSILFFIGRITRYRFRCNYLRKKYFKNSFLLPFYKSKLIFEYFVRKDDPTAFVFPKLRTLKTWLDKCLKSPVQEYHSTSNMVNGPKHCWYLHHSTFIIFIGDLQGNCVRKSLSYSHATPWDFLLRLWLRMKCIMFLIDTI